MKQAAGRSKTASSAISAGIARTPNAPEAMPIEIVAVHAAADHVFSKATVPQIELIAGHGVRGDAHYGPTVKHRSRAARNPDEPNLRQVHLLHDELFDALREMGHTVLPGQMGENVTTRGLDILGLSTGTQLRLGTHAVVEVTGLRNPCSQIERFMPGLLAAVIGRAADGSILRKAGVMCVVLTGGIVRTGDTVAILRSPPRHQPLQPV